ncbi:MAG TPA: CBS and ACT domain-containing protein [bacterium]
MFVADWMTREVVTVGPDESIAHAMHLMRERGIKHLPVLKDGRLVGVISDRDIKAFMPSKATTLDVYEINYLLAKETVKDAMGRQLVTTTPDAPVEGAALVMLEGDIGCLPVVEGGKLVGIISDRDIFRALVDITGARHPGHRIFVTVADRPGSIREVADRVRNHGFSLLGILSSYENVPKGSRRVVIRTGVAGDFEALRADLQAAYPGVDIRKG